MSLRSNYPQQLLADALPVLEDLIYDELDKYPDYIPEIFRMQSTDQWGEQTLTMAGPKAAVQKNEGENSAEDSPIEGYSKTYIPVTYSLSVTFSEELMEDNRMNMVEDTYRGLGLSMYQTEQITAFNVLNNGFTDTGPDGQNLFDTAHPMIGGHSYGNRPSTDISLSVAGLRAMEVAMLRQVNHRNINISVMPQKIIVPPELSQTLDELIHSSERPDTPNRAKNTFMGKYTGIVSPFLTSVTAWMAIANASQHQLRFVRRVNPTVTSWEDKANGDARTKIRARWDVGYSDFIGTWGTTG